jgi:hypothetical protein
MRHTWQTQASSQATAFSIWPNYLSSSQILRMQFKWFYTPGIGGWHCFGAYDSSEKWHVLNA